ncbi:MAG: alpha/beta fold hydrolase [Clostridia bacterium]|nr:alpha/beta fold hydrolase [Clostridia bacterium]
MKTRIISFALALLLALTALSAIAEPAEDEPLYDYTVLPLERNGVALHLDCVTLRGSAPRRNILLTHGVTYSSHEFDIDYEDYSLVRFLARNGYAVWRLDIAGFGQSGDVEDGFMPDSDYAAEDIAAAVEAICHETGRDRLDLLGWSWGTVTASRFAIRHPEYVERLVLYAPILSGIGAYEVTEPFHHNTWEHAADDFQRDADGHIDPAITDPLVVELFCSGSWHYDKEYSPNGGRRDICVDASESLIDLSAIAVPTLVICGDSDPYLDYARIESAAEALPEGSRVEIIPGGAHVLMYEAPYYHDFQARLNDFLSSGRTYQLEQVVALSRHDIRAPLSGSATTCPKKNG